MNSNMGDMGERFGIGVKALGFCLVIWAVGDGLLRLIDRVARFLSIDMALLVNAAFIIMLCTLGWIALWWSDRNKPIKK